MRTKALLTIDFEDYRRQQLRDHLRTEPSPNPQEVEGQLDILLDALHAIGARATFFSVGRLTKELRPSAWARIVEKHELGCHGYEHDYVYRQGPGAFREDVLKAKSSLEDAAGIAVRSFRAPYFSSDGCDPWFGATLAETGFQFDSSRRIGAAPRNFEGSIPLEGSGGAVHEVPMPSIGVGLKRLTVIGGTYFRLLPLGVCRALLRRARRDGFVPMVYLHPYDVDPSAAPLEYPPMRHWRGRVGDQVRRVGRTTAVEKLHALANEFEFESIASLMQRNVMS